MQALSKPFRVVWWILSRHWAPLMALGWPALALYGAISPRAADVAAIHQIGGAAPVLIGIAGGWGDCHKAEPCAASLANRSYLVFPDALTDAAVTVVEEARDGVVVRSERGVALVVLAVWLVCIYVTWRLLIRPRVMASITSPERTRGE